jgi:hypothetical protein
MIYKKFNKYICEYFFNLENFGETIIMAVDETVMADFYDKFNFTEQSLIDDFKQTFIYSYFSFDEEKKIPNFFGFVGIQIYVAYLMHNDKSFTERAYRPRLADFLQIDEKYELKRLFEIYQEKAWKMLYKWGTENGFVLHIPKAEELQWNRRFVPYPLSQALLNQEDLKKAPLLFQNAGLKPDEHLSFKSFKKLIKDSDNNIGLPSHYYRIKERLQEQNKEDLLYYQLFGYFNEKWDGFYPSENEKIKSKHNQIDRNRTNLIIDNELNELSVINNDFNYLYKCSIERADLFNSIRKYYNPFYNELFIFTQDAYYDEWIDCRYLEINHEHILICKKNSPTESFIHNLDSNHARIELKNYLVFKVRIGEKRSKHFYWNSFFNTQPKNYALEGGLKLSRKTWMHGAGPNIIFFERTDAWINGEKIYFDENNFEISCNNFEAGTYRLKVNDFAPEKFEIKGANYIAKTFNLGWKINRKNISWEGAHEDYQIIGLSIWFPQLKQKANTQTWITALTSKSNNRENSSIVITAIKRAKYGITKSNH